MCFSQSEVPGSIPQSENHQVRKWPVSFLGILTLYYFPMFFPCRKTTNHGHVQYTGKPEMGRALTCLSPEFHFWVRLESPATAGAGYFWNHLLCCVRSFMLLDCLAGLQISREWTSTNCFCFHAMGFNKYPKSPEVGHFQCWSRCVLGPVTWGCHGQQLDGHHSFSRWTSWASRQLWKLSWESCKQRRGNLYTVGDITGWDFASMMPFSNDYRPL